MASDWPFTPEVKEGRGGWQIFLNDADTYGLYEVQNFVQPDDTPGDEERAVRENGANANLIAMAPAMYRALKHLFTAMDAPWTEGLPSGGSTTPAYEELRKIIDWIDQR